MRLLKMFFQFLFITSFNNNSNAQNINIPHLAFENRTETKSADTILPLFPGGDSAFFNFLSEHIKYPEFAIQNDLQGSVFMQFTVLSDSTISDIKTLRDVGGGCKD